MVNPIMKMKSTNTIRVDDFINFIPTDTYHSTASISSSFIKSTTWVSQRHSPNSTCTQNQIRDVACVGTTPSFSATCQSTLEAINTSQRLLATQVVHSSLAHGNHVCSKTWNFESCAWTWMRKLLLKWMSKTLPCWKNNHSPSDAVTQRM